MLSKSFIKTGKDWSNQRLVRSVSLAKMFKPNFLSPKKRDVKKTSTISYTSSHYFFL